jgi:hypothetical protein
VVLRLLLLKHIRNWSYGALEREVRRAQLGDLQKVRGAGCEHEFHAWRALTLDSNSPGLTEIAT